MRKCAKTVCRSVSWDSMLLSKSQLKICVYVELSSEVNLSLGRKLSMIRSLVAILFIFFWQMLKVLLLISLKVGLPQLGCLSSPQSYNLFLPPPNTVVNFVKIPKNFVRFYAFSALLVIKWPKLNPQFFFWCFPSLR